MRSKTSIVLATLALVAACKTQASQTAPPTAPIVPAEPAVLYGRDGKPVGAAPRGAVAEQDQAGGRMTLLELYQKSCEERDALLAELELVRADLERTQTALLDAQQRIAGYETSSTSELQSLDALRAENLDLAARLATAHIRRMEAEKTLLELRIAMLAEERAKSVAASDSGAGEHAPEHKQ
ncbi:MAG: hypothetical protein IT453_03255 [Planctomycetes bacterium]|nr:hypothetical protein [Planctomycetota bacterium]